MTPRRIAFRPAGPPALTPTEPTRVTLVWWESGELVLVEPPPSAPAGAHATTIVAVWPSREVLLWHLTQAQVDRLYELHTRWPWKLDAHDVRAYPDGDIWPCMDTARTLLGDTSAAVARLADVLASRAA